MIESIYLDKQNTKYILILYKFVLVVGYDYFCSNNYLYHHINLIDKTLYRRLQRVSFYFTFVSEKNGEENGA